MKQDNKVCMYYVAERLTDILKIKNKDKANKFLSEFKDEIECSKYLISKKYKTVLLNETSCYHNGYNKRTNNFKH